MGTPGYGNDCSGGEPTAVDIIEYVGEAAVPYVDQPCWEDGWGLEARKTELG